MGDESSGICSLRLPPWLRAGALRVDDLRPATGRGVRIAIVDSGVHAAHPHVATGPLAGVAIDRTGARSPDIVDRLGHGTAVAAAIREKAPGAALLVAKVFDRELATSGEALVAAIDWAAEQGAHLVNLSLGTSNPAHATAFQAALERARAAGMWVVAAGAQEGVNWQPGNLPGAISVALDWTLPRDHCVVEIGVDVDGSALPAVVVRASGYPRPIPGVPPDRNLRGQSFAVANATGLLAAAMERHLGNG